MPESMKTAAPARAATAQWPGLGPKSAALLARAGITTLAELQRVGAVAAFVRARHCGTGVSLNLLWGLESAITGLPWQTVARVHRTSLLLALEDHERARADAEAPVRARARGERRLR
jgi:DNA transformation protein and related proteins